MASTTTQGWSGRSIDRRREFGISKSTFWCPSDYLKSDFTGMLVVNPELEFAFQCPVCTLVSISSFRGLTARHRIESPLELWETPRSVFARDSDECRNTITSDIGDDSISTRIMWRNIFKLENATNTKYLEMQLFFGSWRS